MGITMKIVGNILMLLVKNRYMREIKNQREIDPDFSLALSIIDYLENKKNS